MTNEEHQAMQRASAAILESPESFESWREGIAVAMAKQPRAATIIPPAPKPRTRSVQCGSSIIEIPDIAPPERGQIARCSDHEWELMLAASERIGA